MKIVWNNVSRLILICVGVCCIMILTALFFNLKNAKQKSKEYDQVKSDLDLVSDHLKAVDLRRLFIENKHTELQHYIQNSIVNSNVNNDDFEVGLSNVAGRRVIIKYIGNLKGGRGLVITLDNHITTLNR